MGRGRRRRRRPLGLEVDEMDVAFLEAVTLKAAYDSEEETGEGVEEKASSVLSSGGTSGDDEEDGGYLHPFEILRLYRESGHAKEEAETRRIKVVTRKTKKKVPRALSRHASARARARARASASASASTEAQTSDGDSLSTSSSSATR